MTPGQELYEVLARHFTDELDTWCAWDELEDHAREIYQDAARAVLAPLREQYASLLGQFHGGGSAGWSLRLSGVVLTRRYAGAGLPLPGHLKHLEGQ